MLTDFRTCHDLQWAARASAPFGKPRAASAAAKRGLRYENRVEKELWRHVREGRFLLCEHNPWFAFRDFYGSANCAPDFVLHGDAELTIVEVKLTWVEVAIHKLNEFYHPVISCALGRPAWPLVICRNLTPAAPPAETTFSAALASSTRLLHWPDIGHIPW